MRTYVAPNPVYTFQQWWSLSRCEGCQFRGHYQRRRFLNWLLITSWMIHLLYSLEYAASSLDLDSSDHRTVQVEWTFSQRRWLPFWIRLLLYTMELNLHLWMSQWTVATDSGFWRCSWAHAVISMTEWCLFIMQCLLRACRSKASQIDFQPRVCALRLHRLVD